MSKTIVYQRMGLALVLSALLSAVLLCLGDSLAYADDDEERVGDGEESGSGFGLQERERDREGFGFLGESEDGEEDDDNREGGGLLGNNNVSSLVLGGTILAILGAGGYAGYKLLRIQQKKSSVVKGSKA
jgi:hypothetical protein